MGSILSMFHKKKKENPKQEIIRKINNNLTF